MRLHRLLHGAGLGVLLLLPLGPAAAAPQILGVVATNEARPLHCRDGQCAAYLSTFCIQRERDAPAVGTAYVPAPGGDDLTLVITTAGGTTLRLPAGPHLRFASYGGYSAVRVGIPEATLKRLGAVSAALEAGPRATLVPEPVAGDPNPVSEQEIALAAGPLRAAAEHLFGRAGGTAVADAARIVSALVNVLPERGWAGAAERDTLWTRAVRAGRLAGLSETGVERARMAYGACRWLAASGYGETTRRCLERTHDSLMMDLNKDYWDHLSGV